MSPIRTVTAVIALVAATSVGGTMAFAANPPTPTVTRSTPAAAVTAGQAEHANGEVGTNESGEIANADVDTAAEADNNGANDQAGDQVETGQKGTAGDTSKQEPSSREVDQQGTSGSAGQVGGDTQN